MSGKVGKDFVLLELTDFLDAVYWPTRIKPDGGRGFMDGSGWATVMLTWFYSLWWFTIADAAKTLIQWVFRKTTEAELATKEHGTKLPGWAKAVTAPGRLSEQLINKMRRRSSVSSLAQKYMPCCLATSRRFKRTCSSLLFMATCVQRCCHPDHFCWAYLRGSLLVQKGEEDGKQEPLPQVEGIKKSAEGDTVLSFSQPSAGSQIRRNSKSFRSSNLSRGSSHLAA